MAKKMQIYAVKLPKDYGPYLYLHNKIPKWTDSYLFFESYYENTESGDYCVHSKLKVKNKSFV